MTDWWMDRPNQRSVMYLLRMSSVFLVSLFSFLSVQAQHKVIYGEDSRVDVVDSHYAHLASSTAAMILHSSMVYESGYYEIQGQTLASRGICADERFADQITAANCSGFLVAPDLLVTAGHCVRSQRDCDNSAWVFGFALDDQSSYFEGDTSFWVDENNVYHCEEVVETVLDRTSQADHALIRLSRKVDDREPLEVRTEGKVEMMTPLVVIGHPTGLPTKVAADGFVRSNSESFFFQAGLDTFGGNSGSAVFNRHTGVVEGILVRGEQDYVFDSSSGCRRAKVCAMDECRGEDVARITKVESLMDYLASDSASVPEPGPQPDPEPRCFTFFGFQFCL